MNKREFLNTLRNTLTGELPSGKVSEHVQYYDQYISDEVRKGTPEPTVLEELGDPRLIARTILETSGADMYSGRNVYEQETSGTTGTQENGFLDKLKSGKTFRWIIAGLMILLVIASIFTILRVILPLALPILGILLIVSFLKKK